MVNQSKARNAGVFFLTFVMLVATLVNTSPSSVFAAPNQQPVPPSPSSPSTDNPTVLSTYLPLVRRANGITQNNFGIESYNFIGANQSRGVETGAAFLRRNALLWSEVEPADNTYNWSAAASLENDMKNASNAGMQNILVIRSSPSWNQFYPGVRCGPPANLAAFGDFMFDVVKRYSVPPYNVKYYQIWNEPDVDHLVVPENEIYGCWGVYGDPYYGGRYYGEALKAVYPRIKQADPTAQVVIGGLLLACRYNPTPGQPCNWTGSQFLEGILIRDGSNDGKNYFDYVAYHAYDDFGGVLGRFNNGGWDTTWNDEGPVIVTKTKFIKDVLALYNASNKGLIVSEIALRCIDYNFNPPGAVCSNSQPGSFVQTKTSYIPQAYAVAIKEGITAGIWYDLSGSWLQTALLDTFQGYTDGFWAFKTAQELLKDTAYIRDIDEFGPGVKGYAFQGNGREIWLIWSHDGSPHTITLPSLPNAAYSVLKQPVSVPSLNFQVTIMPVYFEW